MKDLSRHIEYLLWEHDSVVIPGFGALVVKLESARYILEEELYLPPYRSVRFVPEIKEDDGKLQSCLVRLHHINTSVAQKWIKEYVSDLNTTLLQEGEIDLGTIGTLYQEDGVCSFASCEAGVNSPTLYGLDSFVFKKNPEFMSRTSEHDPHSITIRISRRNMRIVSSIAACLLIACMILVPTREIITNPKSASIFMFDQLLSHFRQNENVSQDKTLKTGIKPALVSQKKNPTPVTVKKNHETGVQKEKSAQEDSNTTTEVAKTSSTPEKTAETNATNPTGYCLVLVSAVPESNAESYVKNLKERGYSNAYKLASKSMIRVVLTGYSTEAEAYTAARKLRTESDEFENVWVMALK